MFRIVHSNRAAGRVLGTFRVTLALAVLGVCTSQAFAGANAAVGARPPAPSGGSAATPRQCTAVEERNGTTRDCVPRTAFTAVPSANRLALPTPKCTPGKDKDCTVDSNAIANDAGRLREEQLQVKPQRTLPRPDKAGIAPSVEIPKNLPAAPKKN